MLWIFITALSVHVLCLWFSFLGDPLSLPRLRNNGSFVILVQGASLASFCTLLVLLALKIWWQEWDSYLAAILSGPLTVSSRLSLPSSPRGWRWQSAAMTFPVPPSGYLYSLTSGNQLWSRTPLTRSKIWNWRSRRPK